MHKILEKHTRTRAFLENLKKTRKKMHKNAEHVKRILPTEYICRPGTFNKKPQ